MEEELFEEFAIGPIMAGLMGLVGVSAMGSIVTAAPPVAPPSTLSVVLQPATESPEPGVIYKGGMMGIHGILVNTTGAAFNYHMEWLVNDEKVWKVDGRIASGNTHDNYFRYTVPEIGDYVVRITVDGLEVSATFTAIEAPPGEPDIHDAHNSPLCHYFPSTGAVWGSLWPENYGTGTGSYVLEWYIDDKLMRTHEGMLAPGAYDCNEIYIENSEWNPAPGTHTMHCILKWDGHEDRYPHTGYKTFELVGGAVSVLIRNRIGGVLVTIDGHSQYTNSVGLANFELAPGIYTIDCPDYTVLSIVSTLNGVNYFGNQIIVAPGQTTGVSIWLWR